MKAKIHIFLLTIALSTLATARALPAAAKSELSLVPLPQKVAQGEGEFRFKNRISVSVADYAGDSLRRVFHPFAKELDKIAGVKTQQVKSAKATIVVKLASDLAPEAYRLSVTKKQIVIEASRPAGCFYALKTLRQLFPSRVMQDGRGDLHLEKAVLPVVEIYDAPRFAWRGFMLDEGRHFYGKEEVKKIIDVMASYKMNRFHWHLTEDQGWRIEILKYPKLTSVGAWRNSVVLGWGDVKPDGKRYGGYYTQADAREIVKYARARFIEIIPEVDIPGHSQAAVASYPEILSCDVEQKHEVWLWQGISADVINVANPRAVQFAKDVIDELTDIFPYEYIHLGGDECPTTKWEHNALCRERLEAIGSNNYRDLQTDFYRQLKEHIAQLPEARRRRLIFWNEVLHGNTDALGRDITIMAWVGANKAAQDAAQRGMTTILSPQIPFYINRRQSPLPGEPHSQGSGTETVEAVYNYRPMSDTPASLAPQYLGVQANFWSEWVENAQTLQYLILPRLAAVAETAWTNDERRNYDSFRQRIQAEREYYDLKNMNYGKHIFNDR